MPPAARLTDMHTCSMQTPAFPSPIPHVGGPVVGPGVPNVLIGNARPGTFRGERGISGQRDTAFEERI